MLNEDARSHWLGRDNVGYATIEGKRIPVLLDMGANVNMITPECMVALGLQMWPLMDLHEGGITFDQPFNYEGRLIGYVIMSVQIEGISGYNEDQVALMACIVLLSLHTTFPLYWELLPWIGPLRLSRRAK